MTPSQTPTDFAQILTLLAAAQAAPARQQAGASISARHPWRHLVDRPERPDLGSATRHVHSDWRQLQRRPACEFPLSQNRNRPLTSASTSVP